MMMSNSFARLSTERNPQQNHEQVVLELDFAAKSLRGKGSLFVLPSLVQHDRRKSHYGDDDGTESCNSDYSRIEPNRLAILTTLVMFVGAIGASIFVGYGIRRNTQEEEVKFGLQTEEVAVNLEVALLDYERGGKWLHQACSTHHVDREEFRKIYQYISSSFETVVSVSLSLSLSWRVDCCFLSSN
jgi:hypothetical protein